MRAWTGAGNSMHSEGLDPACAMSTVPDSNNASEHLLLRWMQDTNTSHAAVSNREPRRPLCFLTPLSRQPDLRP